MTTTPPQTTTDEEQLDAHGEPVTGTDKTLAETLAFYDGSDFHTSESEKHTPFVTPRAFLSEVGYDVDEGSRIINDAGAALSAAYEDAEICTLLRLPAAADREYEKCERIAERDGYVKITAYYIQGHVIGERRGRGSVLIRYHGCWDEPPVSDTHGYYGHYLLSRRAFSTLLYDLLGDTVPVYDGSGGVRAPVGKDEPWNVLRYDSDALYGNKDLLKENRIAPESEQ